MITEKIINDFLSDFESPKYLLNNIKTSEENDEYKIEILIAGLNKKDIDVSVEQNNTLKISSEKPIFGHSSPLNQLIRIPRNVNTDAICGKVENGILYITIPKTCPTKKQIIIH